MKKLISVIIPTYNRAKMLAEAINSVLKQTYQNFEILIVDDGSSDNTSEIVGAFNDSRIKYIYQQNSAKPSIARNVGIKNANGEYIAFLDSDDLWHHEKLEKQSFVLDNNPKVGLVTNWSLYKTFEEEEIKIKKHRAKNQMENIKYILTSPDRVFTGTPTLLIRKKCFESIDLFDEALTFCEDWDLFFRIAVHYEIYNINEVLTYVRVHKENLSKTQDVTKFREGYLMYLQKAFENKDLHPRYSKLKNKAFSNAFWCIGSWAQQKSNDSALAKKSFVQSIKYSPYKLLNIKFLLTFAASCSPKPIQKAYELFRKNYRKMVGKKY